MGPKARPGRRATAGAALVALALTGCTQAPARRAADVGSPSPTPVASRVAAPTSSPSPGRVAAQAVAPSQLVPFGSCSDLLARLKREALREVGPYGLPFYGGGVPFAGGVMVGTATGTAGAPVMAAAAPAAAPGGGPSFSGTNDQEAGVDEPDAVKTDGRLLVVVRQGGVQVVDVRGTRPRLRGFLSLGQGLWDAQLLMLDGRAVVLGTGMPRGNDPRPWTDVRVLSLADPDHPRVEREFAVDGSLTAARALDGRVLVVAQSSPAVVWSYPTDGTRRGERRALVTNRRKVRATGLSAWLPRVRALRTGRVYQPACSSGLRPQVASGAATTTLVSFDPGSDVPGRQVTVAGGGSMVYASPRWVYVTTSPWDAQPWADARPAPDPARTVTRVHAFDVSDPARPRYVASGSVAGVLVGQYAMSEQDGYLRVASTTGQPSAEPGDPPPASESRVTVLQPVGGRLLQVGLLRGLGPEERIYGVRFVGDLAYVVTFRQTDPLYVLDLADPRRPRLRGVLPVTGYSSYLHPLGDGLLLGIGQAVSEDRASGTQLSTFDVSDVRSPRLRSRESYPSGSSPAEQDPHALLWWPAQRLLVLPLSQQQPASTPERSGFFWGSVVLRVDADGGLHELARIEPPQQQPDAAPAAMLPCCGGGMLRSVVVGDQLLTLSDGGVLASALDTLKERSWSPYR